jgi:hypothetical protein
MRELAWLRRMDMRASLAGVILLAALATGCGGRMMTITVADYINTGFAPKGAPLEVDIVTVLPKDFKDEKQEVNQDLLPDAGITSDVWFERKPTARSMRDSADVDHFQIPKSQIFSFTDRKDVYGQRCGEALVGAAFRDDGAITVKGIPPSSAYTLHRAKSAIYVFCRFQDPDGRGVLRTRPAVFSPVGSYRQKLAVRIKETSVEIACEPTFKAYSPEEESQESKSP